MITQNLKIAIDNIELLKLSNFVYAAKKIYLLREKAISYWIKNTIKISLFNVHGISP